MPGTKTHTHTHTHTTHVSTAYLHSLFSSIILEDVKQADCNIQEKKSLEKRKKL